MRGVEKLVGRQDELGRMHVALIGNRMRRNQVILSGLGGIGKSQLAIAYGKHYQDSYSAIFWFNAQDETSLKQGFAKAARRIVQYHPSASRLSGIDLNEGLDNVVEAVNAWLSEAGNTRWLAIYDNYDNPKLPGHCDPTSLDIEQFLPEAYHGSIIITTRSSEVDMGSFLQVRKLHDLSESCEILSDFSRRDLSIHGMGIECQP
jgi:hypothetical protein